MNLGEDALLYLRKKCVDLVLLDMIMDPGMDGYETFQKIQIIPPHKKAFSVSGFSESATVKNTFKLEAKGFNKNPIR